MVDGGRTLRGRGRGGLGEAILRKDALDVIEGVGDDELEGSKGRKGRRRGRHGRCVMMVKEEEGDVDGRDDQSGTEV